VKPVVALDTSALMAVLFKEADALRFHTALLGVAPVMSLATRVEAGVVARRRLGRDGIAEVEGLLADYKVEFVPLDDEQAAIALDAMDRYGKGRGAEPAALNYGDLFSYALAKVRDLPLLYKGDDFARTDVRSALAELGGG
jgi:ribonuclease VapC